MRQLLLTLVVLIAGFSATSQQAETVKLNQLQEIMEAKTDHIKVINFWATWCAPCIKELPLFEKLGQERLDVKVTLVSMDLDLDPFLAKFFKQG